MSHKTGFYEGRLGIGLANDGGDGTGNPRFPLDVNGDIRLTGAILKANGEKYLGGLTKMGMNNMTELQNGNIGIGTTSPDAKLHVNATSTLGIYSMGDYTDYNYILNGPRPGESKGDGAVLYITSASYSGNDGEASTFTIRNDDGPTRLGKNNYKTTIEGDNIILNSNVGIGTTSPGYKLEVNGSAKLGDTTVSYLKSHLSSGTGIWFDYADTMRFITNNTEKMIIKSDGNVGIGTTSPGAKLEVNGRIGCGGWSSDGNDSAFCIGNDTNWGMKFVKSGSSYYNRIGILGTGNDTRGIQFYDNNGGHTRMFISGNGNVGIGTTSPDSILHLKSTGDVILRLEADTNNSGENDNPMIFMSQDGTVSQNNQYFKIGMNGDTGAAFTGALGNGAYLSSNDYLQFAIGGEAVMTMKYQNKYVGIGTTDPAAKLEIYKTVASGKTNTTPTNPSCLIYGDHEGEILWIGHPNQTQGIQLGYNTIKKWSTNNGATNDSLYFNISGSSDMVIDSAGNVGIGTTNPYAKLICQGTSEPTTGSGYTNTPANMAWPIVVNNVSAAFGNPSNAGYGCGIKFKQYFDNVNDQRWSGIAGVSQGQYSDETGLTFYTCNNYVTTEKMRILHNGNVGIGIASPSAPLHVKDNVDYGEPIAKFEATGDAFILIENNLSNNWGEVGVVIRGHATSGYWLAGTDDSSSYQIKYDSSDFHFGTPDMLSVNTSGYVGIGTTSPSIPLHVASYRTGGSWITSTLGSDGAWYGNESVNLTSGSYSRDWIDSDADLNANMWGGDTDPHEWASDSNMKFSGLFDYHLCIDNGHSLLISSDERIKLNITDVPDDLALYKLRKIPCRFYHYKDIYNKGSEPTIGFIAQEVKKHLPIAVTLRPGWVPSVYKRFDNSKILWEEITDGSDNAYFKLTCENEIRNLINLEVEHLEYYTNNTDISGVFYKFICSNNNDRKTEKTIEVIGNMDNTFTFKKKWDTVFCYGHRVNDFHSLDKQKLFALNFSATQEIDKIQQEEVGKLAEQTSKITELENKVATLESELATIKAHLGI